MNLFSRPSKVMRRKGLKLWKHGMAKHIKTKASIQKITGKLLKKLWINIDFMQWVWMFAAKISHDRRTLVARLMEEGTNIMEMVTKSDIAWSILVLLNNEKYWDYLGGKRTSVAPAIEEGPSEELSEDGDESAEEEVDPTLPELLPHHDLRGPPESPARGTRAAKKRGA